MRLTPGIAARPTGGPPAPTGVWEPLTGLGASLIEWWDADTGITAGGGAVSSWVGRKLGLDVTGSGAARPDYQLSGSLNTVQFVAASEQTLVFEGTLTGFPVGGTPGEIWLVAQRFINNIANDAIFGYGNASQDRKFMGPAATGTYTLSVSNGAATRLQDSTDAGNGFQVYGGFFDSTAVIGGRTKGRDFSPATVSTGQATNTVGTRVRFGATLGATPVAFPSIRIRQALVTTALTANQRYQLEGWGHWNSDVEAALVAGHPYKSMAP